MNIVEPPALQDLFLRSSGKPLCIEGKKIIQMDRVTIPSSALVRIRFMSSVRFKRDAAVIALPKPGKIFLSDGLVTTALAIWNEPKLPLDVVHLVESGGHSLEVFNKYLIRHSDGFISEDNFTGNAGMHVVEVSNNVRRYECSNGAGPFSLRDLVFELSWEPMTAQQHIDIGFAR